MTLDHRIFSFAVLGSFLQSFLDDDSPVSHPGMTIETWSRMKTALRDAINKSREENAWFEKDQVRLTLAYWAAHLTHRQLDAWMAPYRSLFENKNRVSRVGVVMAGNIPMVGFHDLLSILISGDFAAVKLSSQDRWLIPVIMEWLTAIDSDWGERVVFAEEGIGAVDAIIATGSGNTSRYFAYYFGKIPRIIRKNRYGVALLTGKETPETMDGIAFDIFSYFGLGCRNVSKLFVPRGMDLSSLHQALQKYHPIWHHQKYRNNYEYYKSLHLVNRTPFIDGGFYMLMENEGLGSPVSVIHFSYYTTIEEVMEKLNGCSGQIQCVICQEQVIDQVVFPGRSQSPQLWDYADGVDTIRFLCEKN